MTYAISAWWGYATAADKQRLDAFIRIYPTCGTRWSVYPADGPNLRQLVSDGDEAFFARILANQHHVLRQLLPNTTTHNYGLQYAAEGIYALNIKSEIGCRVSVVRGIK